MAKDILLDETGDLLIVNGDFVIGDSNNQEIEGLLVDVKGEVKEHPMVGADIKRLLKSREGETAALKEIKIQLQNDGFTSSQVEISQNDINVSAKRRNENN